MDKAPIPKNIDGAGYLFKGFFKIRNTVEAAVAIGIIILIFKLFLSNFLSPLLMLTIGASICVIVGFFFIVGIDNQPISVVFLDLLNYKKTKGILVLRMPAKINMSSEKRRRKVKIKLKKKRRV